MSGWRRDSDGHLWTRQNGGFRRGPGQGFRRGAIAAGGGAAAVTLPEDITLNGQTVSPMLRFDGRVGLSTTAWTAVVGGTDLDVPSGTLVKPAAVSADPPFTAFAVDSIDWNSSGYFEVDNDSTSDYDVTTEDLVYEFLVNKHQPTGSSTSFVFAKFTVSGSAGYGIGHQVFTPDGFQIAVGVGGSYRYANTGSLGIGAGWALFHVMIDRDNANPGVRICADGVAVGSNFDLSAGAGSATSSRKFNLARFGSGAGVLAKLGFAFLSIWKKDAWLGGDQDQVDEFNQFSSDRYDLFTDADLAL